MMALGCAGGESPLCATESDFASCTIICIGRPVRLHDICKSVQNPHYLLSRKLCWVC